ncbi:hypothetical protein VFPBJ_07507 [Purpureocillium lilacinum]|uniref:Uncharacterized protein n=1 Tax=Purpureocillium lilacinum TaxID=33203 RepID=A0A179GGR9_PURLI|nr:hypothetical protein VFPBJ_07507 [Purpureocillium lilacinum]
MPAYNPTSMTPRSRHPEFFDPDEAKCYVEAQNQAFMQSGVSHWPSCEHHSQMCHYKELRLNGRHDSGRLGIREVWLSVQCDVIV